MGAHFSQIDAGGADDRAVDRPKHATNAAWKSGRDGQQRMSLRATATGRRTMCHAHAKREPRLWLGHEVPALVDGGRDAAQFPIGYQLHHRGSRAADDGSFANGWTLQDLHVAMGMTILALALARTLWRVTTTLPPWAEFLSPIEREVESIIEKVLLALLLLVPATGLPVRGRRRPVRAAREHPSRLPRCAGGTRRTRATAHRRPPRPNTVPHALTLPANGLRRPASPFPRPACGEETPFSGTRTGSSSTVASTHDAGRAGDRGGTRRRQLFAAVEEASARARLPLSQRQRHRVSGSVPARCGYVIFGRATDHPAGHVNHLMRGTDGFAVGTIRKSATGAAKCDAPMLRQAAVAPFSRK